MNDVLTKTLVEVVHSGAPGATVTPQGCLVNPASGLVVTLTSDNFEPNAAGPNPNGLDRDEVSAELGYRAAWPSTPRGCGWVPTASTPPRVGVHVLGYYPGHFGGRRFFGGEFLVVRLTGLGEWSSAADETSAPAYWRPIPGAAGTPFPD